MIWSIILKVIAVVVCGILWRAGGSDEYPKVVRRLGCAIVICLAQLTDYIGAGWTLQMLYLLPGILIHFGVFTIGYGGDDADPKPSTIYRLLRPYMGSEKETMDATRIICAILYGISGVYYAIIQGAWIQYAIVFPVVVIGVSYFTTQARKIFTKTEEEILVGRVVGIEGFI